VQHGPAGTVGATLGLGDAHAALVHTQHALGDRLDRLSYGQRNLACAHRPVGDRTHVEQQRAAASEEPPRAARAPDLDHAVERLEQQQAAAAGRAQAMDLAQQIGWML
jgi:hypothetical protein